MLSAMTTTMTTPMSTPLSTADDLSESTRPTPRWIRIALALLLLLNLALRVWNGSAILDTTRFFDERFSFRNVGMILLEGKSTPSNAFYGSLSYLPQTAVLYVSQELHELTGVEWLAVRTEHASDGWSPTAYFLVRSVCALFGMLSIWLTFFLGKRLFNAEVGLLAAVFLGAFPRHILASTEFKPDILVVVFVVLTFLWSLDAIREPTRRRILKAGCGVGLAVATKYTGVGVAIPLAAGLLWDGWRKKKIWLHLVGAGVVSILTFLVLNIHIAVIVAYLPRIWRIMETKGEASGDSHFDVFLREMSFLVHHHGPLLALFALVGAVLLAVRIWQPQVDRIRRLEAVMVLSYIVGYSLLYAGATKLFKGQNYLPVAAFTSVLAAWTVLGAWRFLAARWAFLSRLPVVLLLWGAGVAAIYAPTVTIIYKDVVPTTMELAQDFLRRELRPPQLRHVYYEREEGEADYYKKRQVALRVSTSGGHWLVALPSPQLLDRREEELDLADAEIFTAPYLEDPRYLRRVLTGTKSARFEPSPFRAFGKPLVVVSHPWRLLGEPEVLPFERSEGNRFHMELPSPLQAEDVASLSLWLPRRTGKVKVRQFEVNGREFRLFQTRSGGKRAHYITRRIPLGHEVSTLELSFDPELRLEGEIIIRLCRWAAPRAD